MTTAALSNYLENKIINHVLRNTPYITPGVQVWVALYTNDPTDADVGTEVAGGGYVRQQVTAWDVPANRATQNTSPINFPQASLAWGVVTHIGIRDAATGGNLLFYAALTVSKTVGIGGYFSIPAGDIDVSFGGAYSTYLGNALLSHILRNTAYVSPGTSVYLGLYTTDPTAADSGAECSGGGYARVQVSAWDAPADGATQNTNVIDFPTATGAWGTVTHSGIKDALTLGNLLLFGALGVSFPHANGDGVSWNAGALDVSVS